MGWPLPGMRPFLLTEITKYVYHSDCMISHKTRELVSQALLFISLFVWLADKDAIAFGLAFVGGLIALSELGFATPRGETDQGVEARTGR